MNYVKHVDSRGELIKFSINLDFVPKEFFIIRSVPKDTVRGGHAHQVCCQHIVLLSGKVEITLENHESREIMILDQAGHSVLLPVMTWSEQKFLTDDTELLIFSSETFNESDYIRDYNHFRKMSN